MNQTGTIVAVISSGIAVAAVLYGARTVEIGAFDSTPRFGVNYSWLDQQRVLDATGEISLYDQKSEIAEGYRIIWHRSFETDYVITLTRNRNSDFVLCTSTFEVSGLLKDLKYHGARPNCQELSSSSSAVFLSGIDRIGAWKKAPQSREHLVGVDGSTWSVEMLKDGRYHAATQWSPGPETQIYKLGSLIISTAGIDERKVDS